MRIPTLALCAALSLAPFAAQAADNTCINDLQPVVAKWTSRFVSDKAKDLELSYFAMALGCYSPADLMAAGWPDPSKYAVAVGVSFYPLPPIPTFTAGKIAAQ
jgi:hypothetical protein